MENKTKGTATPTNVAKEGLANMLTELKLVKVLSILKQHYLLMIVL